VAVPFTVRSVVGRAAAPGLRADLRIWALTTGVGRLFVRRRRALSWLTLFMVWYLR
jgi:hypothetical protein